MDKRHFTVANGAGWALEVKCVTDKRGADPDRAPVLFVPGYGMNTHILGFHPRGVSMVEYLCRRGHEVWLGNLRGQGGSRRAGGSKRIGLADRALVDLPAVISTVLENTESRQKQVHAVGCSLGGTLLYIYLAHNRERHDLASVVSLGGPFRWHDVHPIVDFLAKRPRLAGRVPLKGIRPLARFAVPLAAKVPILLSPYMNARRIDLSRTDELVKTVEDPPKHLTRELITWVSERRLVVDGIDISSALVGLELPILCVLANGDGLVPPSAVSSIRDVANPEFVELLEVGDSSNRFAHADLFINDEAEQRVFAPVCDWLSARA